MPATTFWQLLGQLAIALLLYGLASRQFRSNKWWEQRVQRYTDLDDRLLVLKQSTQKLSLQEDRERNPGAPPLYKPDELETFKREATEAESFIRIEVERDSFLLSGVATGLLRSYMSRRATSYQRAGMSPYSDWRGDTARLYANFHGRAKVDMGPKWRFTWWVGRAWRSLRSQAARVNNDLRSKWWAWRRRRLEWKPSEEMDAVISNWLKGEGWDVVGRRYSIERKIYSWLHRTAAGGTSALMISREVLEGYSPSEVLSHIERLKVAEAKRLGGGPLLVLVQTGDDVTLGRW